MDYFNHVASRLSIDEISLLAILTDEDCTVPFKALRKKEVYVRSGLTEANFRKVINRLDAISFIETVTGSKEHKYYITNFGLMAVNQSVESMS